MTTPQAARCINLNRISKIALTMYHKKNSVSAQGFALGSRHRSHCRPGALLSTCVADCSLREVRQFHSQWEAVRGARAMHSSLPGDCMCWGKKATVPLTPMYATRRQVHDRHWGPQAGKAWLGAEEGEPATAKSRANPCDRSFSPVCTLLHCLGWTRRCWLPSSDLRGRQGVAHK